MDPLKLQLPPGFVRTESALTAMGRYVAGENVRFFRNLPQKIGGFVQIVATPVMGIVRTMWTWNDLTARQLLAVGTTLKLYAIPNTDFNPIDITPWVVTTIEANPISTVSGSPTVTISLPANSAQIGQIIDISGASVVGGIDMNGGWTITNTTADTVMVTAPANATATATGGGATVSVNLELPPGLVDPTAGFGWGAGPWNRETWGTPRTSSTILFEPRMWSLNNFGKLLLAAASDQGLYIWDPTASPTPRASIIAGAPTHIRGFYVTAERFIITFGSNFVSPGVYGDQDLMQIMWCAQGDQTDWDTTALAGAAGAPAGSRRLQVGTKIVAGADLGSFISMIWTDQAAYTHQYTGSANTFNTLLAGTKCGLVGRNAFVVVSGVAFWMSSTAFYFYNGSVQRIPGQEDISDWFFGQLRPFYSTKAFAFFNPQYNEIWFVSVPTAGSEPALAAVYNLNGFWFTATIERTAATAFSPDDAQTVMADTGGVIYQHETGLDALDQPLPWSLQTALLQLDDGAESFDIFGFWPDFERLVGTTAIDFTAYDRTPEPLIETQTMTFGPTDGVVDLKLSGRQISLTFSGGDLGCDFRMGSPAVEYQKAGQRR